MRLLLPIKFFNPITILVIASLAIALTTPLRAQDSPCLHRTIIADVLDRKGNPVPGLTAGDFQAKFHGKPVSVSAARFERGRRVVLLIDTSGSMIDVFRRNEQFLSQIVKTLNSDAGPETSFALVSFEDHFQKRLDFSVDRNELLARIQGIQADVKRRAVGRNKTALWDALISAIALFGSPEPGDAIIAVTDGEDNHSSHKSSETKAALLEANVRLFAFVLEESGGAPTPEEEEGPTQMSSLVRATGGIAVLAGKSYPGMPKTLATLSLGPAELEMIFSTFQKAIGEFYELELDLPQTVDKPRKWDLRIENSNSKSKSFQVIFPQELLPCSAGATQK